MFTTTTFSFEGYRIKEIRGIVRGIIVRVLTIAQGIVGGLKSIVGGRIGAYTDVRAGAIAGLRVDDPARPRGRGQRRGRRARRLRGGQQELATEVLCYGTAVVVEPMQ